MQENESIKNKNDWGLVRRVGQRHIGGAGDLAAMRVLGAVCWPL
jgi:hypothetical protein